jgi:flagellar motor protein MotB
MCLIMVENSMRAGNVKAGIGSISFGAEYQKKREVKTMVARGIGVVGLCSWVVVGFVGCASMADYDSVRQRAEKAEKVVRDLQAKADRLETEYEELKAKLRASGNLPSEIAQRDQRIAELQAALKEMMEKGASSLIAIPGTGFQVNERTRGLILEGDAVNFASGRAVIRENYKSKIRGLADAIKKADPDGQALINVDGYTDRQAVDKTKTENLDNWYLGARRAHAVMVFLRDECGFPQERFVLNSFGYLNEIEPGKVNSEKNRRVEIRLIRESAGKPSGAGKTPEPPPGGTGG